MTSLRYIGYLASKRSFKNGHYTNISYLKRNASTRKNVVVLDGVRTPFMYQASQFINTEAYEMAGHTIRAVLERNKVDKNEIDSCVIAQAFQDPDHLNMAKDAAVYAGIDQIPAFTVSNYQASAFSAIFSAHARIREGVNRSALVGGVESFSTIPAYLKDFVRKSLVRYYTTKDIKYMIATFIINLQDLFLPFYYPDIKNPITNQCPLRDAEFYATRFFERKNFRSLLTTFSYASLLNAEVSRNNCFSDIIPIRTQEKICEKDDFDFETRVEEMYSFDLNKDIDRLDFISVKDSLDRNTIGDLNLYSPTMSAYLPRFGDGAACTILMDEQTALSKNLTPKAFIRDIAFTSSNLVYSALDSGLLSLGLVLSRNNLCIEDISVLEVNECTGVEGVYTKTVLENSPEVKKFNPDVPRRYKSTSSLDNVINSWGGTIAFGNPYGATGIRMLNMACNRLQTIPNGRYAVISTNSHGGIGCSILLEKYI